MKCDLLGLLQLSRGIITLLMGVISGISPISAQEPLLVEESANRLQAWRDSIKSIQVSFVLETVAGRPSSHQSRITRVTWAQTPEAAHWKLHFPDRDVTEEYLWEKGTIKSLGTQPKPKADGSLQAGSIVPGRELETTVASPWLHSLLIDPIHPHPSVPDALLDSNTNPTGTHQTVQGHELVSVSYDPSGSFRTTVLLDPEKQYAPVKLVSVVKNAPKTARIEKTVTAWSEPKNGIVFPKVVNEKIFRGDRLVMHNRFTVRSLEINEPIGQDSLSLVFPEGLDVADHVRGTIYRTDANEQPVESTEAPLPLSYDERMAKEQNRPWYERMRNWILLSGACLAIISIGWLVYRWRFLKSTRPEATS